MKATWVVGALVFFALWSVVTMGLFCLFVHLPKEYVHPSLILGFLWHYWHFEMVRRAGILAGALSGVLTAVVAVKGMAPSAADPYGDARWATRWEIWRAGLLGKEGIVVGKRSRRFLCVPGWEHMLCFAPSGAGKGVGLVIPNLLNWPDSMIVHDVKGENFEQTSGFRAKYGQKVFFFNPGDPEGRTHRYNPFKFVSANSGIRVDDLQKIAHLLLPHHEFWENEARTLLVGLALHMLDDGKTQVTFGNLLCTLREAKFSQFVDTLLTKHRQTMNPVAYMALNAFVQKADKERSAVLSTLNAALELWANPLIDAATSGSDFDLRRLKQERTTIYVGVSPNNLHRLRPLLQIFYQQATDLLTEKQPDLKKEPYGVLFLMDEFASLGRMTQFEQASAYFRGYRVRFMMIIQDLPQLERHYERAGLHSFLGLSKVKVTFAANNFETAEMISKHLGTYGAETSSKSRSHPLGLTRSGGSHGESVSKTARALLLPQEILRLPPEESIILLEGRRPIQARKVRYFEEPVFQRRVLAPVALTTVPPVLRELKRATVWEEARVPAAAEKMTIPSNEGLRVAILQRKPIDNDRSEEPQVERSA